MPRMKNRPEDFLVWENLALERSVAGTSAPIFRYVRLRKSGFTTSEAVVLVADWLRVPANEVRYAGLKDEDGITEQTLSLPSAVLDEARLSELGRGLSSGTESRFLHASASGAGDRPVEIGALEGNTFLVTLSSVNGEELARLSRAAKSAFYFVNYYDVQRFGVPDGPKTSHRAGAALAERDFASALALLAAARVMESATAAAHVGDPAEYFKSMDPRRLAFYRSSAASFEWNAALARLLDGDSAREVREGIEFTYPKSQDAVLALLRLTPALPGTTYRAVGYALEPRTVERDTVTQTRFRCWGAGEGRVRIGFQLPPGTYATMAVRQLCLQAGLSP